MKPVVSVVMSVYNDDQFVKEAIESILQQTYTNIEFVIINDGSTDDSLQIINEYAQKDDRIVVLDQQNTGLTKALNSGVAKATGTYIARMDADDISLPTRIESQVAFMEEHPHVAVCGTTVHFIDEKGTVVGEKKLPLTNDDVHKWLLFNNPCLHSSLMIRASVLDKVGGYNESFRTSQDYELLLRIGAAYEIVNLSEVLVHWRVREGSISWSSKRQERDAIKARWLAITTYKYPFLKGIVHILVRCVWYILPQKLKMKRYA